MFASYKDIKSNQSNKKNLQNLKYIEYNSAISPQTRGKSEVCFQNINFPVGYHIREMGIKAYTSVWRVIFFWPQKYVDLAIKKEKKKIKNKTRNPQKTTFFSPQFEKKNTDVIRAMNIRKEL